MCGPRFRPADRAVAVHNCRATPAFRHGRPDEPRYFEGVAALDVGDLFVLYTDGIVESSDAREDSMGGSDW